MKAFANIFLVLVLFSCGYKSNEEKIKEANKHTDSILKANENETKQRYLDAGYVKVTPELINKLKKLKEEKDEFKGAIFYSHINEPRGWSNSINLYLVKSGSNISSRIKVEYTADDWLFIKHYEVLCDGKNFIYTPSEVKHNNSSGEIYEHSDEATNPNTRSLILAIINSKEAKMRYLGADYYKDRVIGKVEKKRLKDVYSILYPL